MKSSWLVECFFANIFQDELPIKFTLCKQLQNKYDTIGENLNITLALVDNCFLYIHYFVIIPSEEKCYTKWYTGILGHFTLLTNYLALILGVVVKKIYEAINVRV